MFNLEQSIAEWRRQMLAAGIKSPVPLEELESHLREAIEEQIQMGASEEKAFCIAVENIGQPTPLKLEFRNGDFLNWLGDDKNTRINRAFALFWLALCGKASFSIGYVWVSGAFLRAVAGIGLFSLTIGLFVTVFFEIIYIRGLIAAICLMMGKNREIRTLRFIAALEIVADISQIVVLKTASMVTIALTIITLASIFLMRLPPQKNSKTART